jgi:glc operon protein GlcG
MYKKEVLGLDQALAAVMAALAEAKKEPGHPVAIAVADERGDLIAYAAMDGAYPLYKYMAIHKAYTAARMQRDTAQFDEWLRETGKDIATWGDSKYTRQHGGLCIVKPDRGYLPRNPRQGTVLGGIGVAGLVSVDDLRIAQAGLNAIQF